ncbi:hypothetical protein AGLY_017811, partial [Aphis glycines]
MNKFKKGMNDELECKKIRSMLRHIFCKTKIKIIGCTNLNCKNVEYTEKEKVTILKQFHDLRMDIKKKKQRYIQLFSYLIWYVGRTYQCKTEIRCYCTFSNSCPNLQQQLQGHLVSPRRRQLDVNKRRTTIYKGARRPATADVPKLSTTEHFHDTQPLILHISLLSLTFVQNNHLDLNLILARNSKENANLNN